MFYLYGYIGKREVLLGIFGYRGIEVTAAMNRGLDWESAITAVKGAVVADGYSRGYSPVEIR